MRRVITVTLVATLLAACSDDQPATSSAEPAAQASPAATPPAPTADTAQAASSNPLREAYFGNLHVHTSWSFDGYINGSITGPDDAYRWAKGEAIAGGGDGTPLQIKAPLDWYVVSDHAEYLGALPLMGDPDSPVSKHALAAAITGGDPAASFNAYSEILDGISNQRKDAILGDPQFSRSIWKQVADIADAHYEPGVFTTLAGFEWTSNPDWRNLHRIVIFADTDKLPEQPFSAIDSDVPENLWAWMDAQRASGSRPLAVPHNGNASDGLMFPVDKSYGGSELDANYSAARMRNEPVYELTQIKGTSETHPSLNPNDEFGSFELWDYTLASTATPPEHKRGGYAREALIRGIRLQSEGRGNPFKYGFIGDSDTHNSASTVEEDNYSGKFGFENDPKHRLQGPPGTPPAAAKQVRSFSSGGLAGVWAEANTREGIFAAIQRKETFATSGPRMKVRLFAGFGLAAPSLATAEGLQQAYTTGVPMGGDLPAAPEGQAPTLMIHALKEVDGANLDRIQIIKGWVDAEGQEQSRIFNVALSDERVADADGRIPAVGNTVNEADASYTNTIGATELSTTWTDPEFDATRPALYYARVIQIPTPRWSTYDAARTGLPRPEDVPVSIQERAWTSPVWYTP